MFGSVHGGVSHVTQWLARHVKYLVDWTNTSTNQTVMSVISQSSQAGRATLCCSIPAQLGVSIAHAIVADCRTTPLLAYRMLLVSVYMHLH